MLFLVLATFHVDQLALLLVDRVLRQQTDELQVLFDDVAEFGNTQLGRIEYALAGGRINTDAIDNSAGVDCSDYDELS